MLVERIMTSPCLTINKETTIEQALELMTQKSVRHLPIVDEQMKLQGIISDRDIKLALPSILSESDPSSNLNTPVEKIMRQNVITCHPLDFVEDIALDFYESSIGSIPVVKHRKVIGIVTQKDMLNTFLELTGVTEPGSSIQVQVPDVPGIMHSVTEVFHEQKVGIESILVYRDHDHPGHKLVTIRMKMMNPAAIIEGLTALGYKVNNPMDNGL